MRQNMSFSVMRTFKKSDQVQRDRIYNFDDDFNIRLAILLWYNLARTFQLTPKYSFTRERFFLNVKTRGGRRCYGFSASIGTFSICYTKNYRQQIEQMDISV